MRKALFHPRNSRTRSGSLPHHPVFYLQIPPRHPLKPTALPKVTAHKSFPSFLLPSSAITALLRVTDYNQAPHPALLPITSAWLTVLSTPRTRCTSSGCSSRVPKCERSLPFALDLFSLGRRTRNALRVVIISHNGLRLSRRLPEYNFHFRLFEPTNLFNASNGCDAGDEFRPVSSTSLLSL